MAEDLLNVEARDTTGTLRMRRLRKTGGIPAILYGHGEECVSLIVKKKEIDRVIGHGGHVVALKGAVNESALIKDVQWDAFGDSVLHLDLMRINPNEKVEVSIPIELVGDAPGSSNGGIVVHQAHEITVICPASKIVDKIDLKIMDLQVNGTITAADLDLPEGAELVGDEHEVIVSCNEPSASAAAEDDDAGNEPEVIGAKDDADEKAND